MFDLYELGAEIAAAHAAVVAAESPALGYAKRCGDLLIKAKKHVAHGAWMSFVTQCGMSTRTAAAYMMLARRWQEVENSSSAANSLTIREALSLLPKVRTRRDPPVPRCNWKDLTRDERREVRRMELEMRELPFVGRTLNPRPDASGYDIVAGCGGAPVYWDIVGGNPHDGRPLFSYTRGDVCQRLEAFIDGGPRSVVSDLAVDVAKRRLAGDRTLSRPVLQLDEDATVTLGEETRELCALLAPRFNANTLDEVVAVAVAFLYASQARDQVEVNSRADDADELPGCLRDLVTADLSDPIGLHDMELVS